MKHAPEVRRGGNLPFGMVASRWMCDPRYSTNARTLYAILVSYADTQSRNTDQGKPFRASLAGQLGVSLSTLDRTLEELVAAGLITVERRTHPDRHGVNDANLYTLHDAGVMWQGNGTWTDPLPPGKSAAEVVKEQTAARRQAKRAAGIVTKGGVAKGVNTRPHRSARARSKDGAGPVEGGSTHAATPPDTEDSVAPGGGSTDAATEGSTHAAGVAAPVLPCSKNLVQNPSPDAPPARSAADARRASHLSQTDAPDGGPAASSTGTPAQGSPARHSRLTSAQHQVFQAIPVELRTAITRQTRTPVPRSLVAAVEHQLAERTADQLADRVARRWHTHGHAARHAAGTLTNAVGTAMALVRAGECGHPRCEDGVDADTGNNCRACAERRHDRRNRNADRMPGRSVAPDALSAAEKSAVDSSKPARARAAACPGCSFPGTGGDLCVACRHRAAADEDTDDRSNTVRPPSAPGAQPGPFPAAFRPGAVRPRCTRCGTGRGRARWSGMCGGCTSASRASGTRQQPARA